MMRLPSDAPIAYFRGTSLAWPNPPDLPETNLLIIIRCMALHAYFTATWAPLAWLAVHDDLISKER